MIAFPNAKINLGLNITSKRADGYHNIESCFYPIPFCDALEIIKSERFCFHSYGLNIPGDSSNNLCVKAYQLLNKDFSLSPVEIHLLKAIPMGAGLGGGSADGAFTLRMLNELFDLKLTTGQLEQYALELGSDCPFFIQNKPMIAKGRGEQLQPFEVDLKGLYLAIHNPGIHISTKEAYDGIIPKKPEKSVQNILSKPTMDWKYLLINDFESSIFPNHPEIATLKGSMYKAGAIYSSMTGSGSTVFGIFDGEIENSGWKWFPIK